MVSLNLNPRSERIALAERRLRAAYARQAGAEVPVVEPRMPPSTYGYGERFEDFDKMLEHSILLAMISPPSITTGRPLSIPFAPW